MKMNTEQTLPEPEGISGTGHKHGSVKWNTEQKADPTSLPGDVPQHSLEGEEPKHLPKKP